MRHNELSRTNLWESAAGLECGWLRSRKTDVWGSCPWVGVDCKWSAQSNGASRVSESYAIMVPSDRLKYGQASTMAPRICFL